MKKWVCGVLLLAICLGLVGCAPKEKGMSFQIDGENAHYSDGRYHLSVTIPQFTQFHFSFDFSDQVQPPEIGELPPVRSLQLFYPHEGDAPDSNVMHIDAWVGKSTFFDDFPGKTATLEAEDGEQGLYKKNEESGRVKMMYARSDGLNQIEIDFSEGAFVEAEATIWSICKSLR